GLEKNKPVALFVVHSESSSGICQPLDGFGPLCHEHDCLLIVDTVASLGGTPFFTDDWELDVVYSGSQKCLGALPGVAPITFSPRAIYHHTAAINLVYALRESLAILAEEGLENSWRRHHDTIEHFWTGLEKMGLEMFVADK
ncbi:unnamed protein product, partial [Porites evermanni]